MGVGKEETFVSIIERCLNEIWSNQGIRKLEVFNGGVPGSYTRHWVKVFARARTEFDPDLVIAVFFLRDGTGPEITSIGMIRQIEQGMRQLERESWLYRHSHLFRLARERQAYQELSKKYLGMIRAGYFGSDEQTTEWYAAQKNLLHIRDTAVSDGRMFAMIIFPVLIDLNEDYPLRDVCETLESFCRKNSIPVLSLLPAFMGEDAPQLWVSAYDQHPNARAHAIAADAILPFVRDLLSKE